MKAVTISVAEVFILICSSFEKSTLY